MACEACSAPRWQATVAVAGVSAVEHPPCSDPHALATEGVETRIVGVDRTGRVDPAAVADAVDDTTALVSIMCVNTRPARCSRSWIVAPCEGANPRVRVMSRRSGFGRYPVSSSMARCRLISIAAHKIYGPKRAGALSCARARSLSRITAAARNPDCARARTMCRHRGPGRGARLLAPPPPRMALRVRCAAVPRQARRTRARRFAQRRARRDRPICVARSTS